MDTVFKEAANLSKTVRWKVLDVIMVAELRVISTHRDYFVIPLALWSGSL